jgi:tetratricopeptide (TPR) repeat protein
MAEQDRLADAGEADACVAAAREAAKDGTAESLYLLGRALGNAAVKRLDAGGEDAAVKLLDEASVSFERSQEAGGLTYAPAHLGLGRVWRFRCEMGLRRAAKLEGAERTNAIDAARRDLDGAIKEYRAALQITKAFKEAAIELTQALWERQLQGDAEYALYQFLKERPDDLDARLLLGVMKLQRKRFAEAEPEFRTVLSARPDHTAARKMLAADLMYQEKWEESAEHWEIVRSATPKDDEVYISLFSVYRQLKKKVEALAVLAALERELPGTEAARRARSLLEEVEKDPGAWESESESSPERLVRRLDSTDPQVVLDTLVAMRAYQWPALPAAVYRVLLRDRGTPAQRLAAVRLIADLADPQTVTILEVMLAHPAEREPDASVRAEVARALSLLPTDAIVPILFETLEDANADVREWSVQGIAARTGKWFRADLDVRTADKDWPSELELYRKWWASSSSSAAKRKSVVALGDLFGRVEKGSRSRVSRYALPAMDDPVEATWRAGYDVFRALTFKTFGADRGTVAPEERERIAREARAWLESEAGKK